MSPTYQPIRLLGGATYNDQSSTYIEGNIHPSHRPNNSYPDTAIVRYTGSQPQAIISQVRQIFYAGLNTIDAFIAKERVLRNAGARLPLLDHVDRRYIDEVNNKKGPSKTPTKPEDVGGYPLIRGGTALPDTDKDGIPDAWELAHGLNPFDSSDGSKDLNGDGYTNLEDYLNSLVSPLSANTAVPLSPKNLQVVNY
jgi:hypothetical protein